MSYHNVTFPFIIRNNYINKRSLISDVNIYKNGEEYCLVPTSSYIIFYPLCYDSKEIIAYNLSSVDNLYNYEKTKDINKKYENITIHNYLDKDYLLYNYKGFYYVNSVKNKKIDLFKKDVYKLELVYQNNNLLIVPDYNSQHYFNKLFVIDIKKGSYKELALETGVSYNSYFVDDNKKLYLVDQKEKNRFIINLRKNLAELTNYDASKDINNSNVYDYKIINNNLYLLVDKYKIKISNKDISNIVKIDKDSVYYLVKDSLYVYNNVVSEKLLMTNFEWNFNNTNVIFISE